MDRTEMAQACGEYSRGIGELVPQPLLGGITSRGLPRPISHKPITRSVLRSSGRLLPRGQRQDFSNALAYSRCQGYNQSSFPVFIDTPFYASKSGTSQCTLPMSPNFLRCNAIVLTQLYRVSHTWAQVRQPNHQ